MERFAIKGGQKLYGSIQVSGAKNAALPILAASLLTAEKVILKNVPNLHDVRIMKEVLKHLGVEIKRDNGIMLLTGEQVTTKDIPEELVRKMRASNLMMGPLLARFGYVKLSYPGGCAIGSRPMDLHLKGFKALGAKVTEKHGYIIVEAAKLKGAEIHLDFPSVGATENLIMAATLAEGTTILRNAAKEPEIVDLADFLNQMGAKITGAGSDVIRIKGVPKLGEVERHVVVPDRIEAGTHMIAAAITGSNVLIEGAITEHLEGLIAKLKEAGVGVFQEETGIRVIGNDNLGPVDIKTLPYPGFATDLQPQMMALLTVSKGTSVISESIFENRYKHVDELRRMGADIKVEGRAAIIKGVTNLSGTTVEATDLRAGAALILAGLAAEGETIIESVEHIYRGYENVIAKYQQIGANIRVIKE